MVKKTIGRLADTNLTVKKIVEAVGYSRETQKFED